MSYDYDLFVLGAGSGGVRASRMSASYGAKVAVAESTYHNASMLFLYDEYLCDIINPN